MNDMIINPEQIQFKFNVTQQEIQTFEYAGDFMTQDGYRALFSGRQTFEHYIQKGARTAFALASGNIIVGYAVIGRTQETAYWGKLGEETVAELNAVEVLREYRRKGIAGTLLKGLFNSKELDYKIICLNGYSWTWDLPGTAISAREYQKMLIRFYEKFGFRQYQTSESNTGMKPENFFMARIGNNVSQKILEAFTLARFGL